MYSLAVAYVDLDQCGNMTSPGHIEYIMIDLFAWGRF